MKIAQIVSTYPPYAGGMGNVVANLAEQLSLDRHEVTIITPRYKSSDLTFLQSSYRIERISTFLRYGKAAILLQLFWKLRHYDIIDLHLPFLGSAWILYILKKIYRHQVPLVVHYHMDLFGRNWFYRKIFGLQQGLISTKIKAADKIIVASQDYLVNSRLREIYKTDPDKFVVIPFGVDTERFFPQPKDPTLVQRYDLADEQVILFVGALDDAHYFKGVNYLLKAFALLVREKTRLIIVGEGNLRQVYQDLAVEYDLADKVIFTGFVPDAQLAKYYNLADVVVLPSIDGSEAFGMVILEAMACGCPVVASDLPGVREVLGYNQFGLLSKPKNPEILMKRVERLLIDQAFAKKMSQDALARIRAEYAWPVVTAKLVKLYEEVIAIEKSSKKI
ncbi:MAG: glycosyltransferase family 4 protein [Candidatus Komeilibacteria bacterium]|nr:glycosyltransferase family 4 protein [Candidatus Komeilibacteria bacterium]